MKVSSILKFNHEQIQRFTHCRACIVDATCGNGHDSFFIKSLYPTAKLYCFDINPNAILKTKDKCCNFKNIFFINDSHENIKNYVTQNIDLAVFNLGYLPNSNQSTPTHFKSTIVALDNCLKLLKLSGAIIITLYNNHDNGFEEKKVLNYILKLNNYIYSIIKYEFILNKNSPYTIVIEKRR